MRLQDFGEQYREYPGLKPAGAAQDVAEITNAPEVRDVGSSTTEAMARALLNRGLAPLRWLTGVPETLQRTGRFVLTCVTGVMLGAAFVLSGCASGLPVGKLDTGPVLEARSAETKPRPAPVAERVYEPVVALPSIPGAKVPEMSHEDLSAMLHQYDFEGASVLDKAEMIRRLGIDGLEMVYYPLDGGEPNIGSHEQTFAYQLYNTIPLQTAFTDAEMPKVRAFSEWLKQSKEVREIRNDWPRLDDDRRLELLRAVHEAQGTIFGFEPCPLSSYQAGNDVFAPGRIGYSARSEELEINFHPDVAGEPEDYIVSVIHGGAYRQGHQLSLAYARGEVAADDPRLVQIALLAVNQDAYIPGGNMGRWAYLTNPMERHAYWLTDAMGELLDWPGHWQDEQAVEAQLAASQP